MNNQKQPYPDTRPQRSPRGPKMPPRGPKTPKPPDMLHNGPKMTQDHPSCFPQKPFTCLRYHIARTKRGGAAGDSARAFSIYIPLSLIIIGPIPGRWPVWMAGVDGRCYSQLPGALQDHPTVPQGPPKNRRGHLKSTPESPRRSPRIPQCTSKTT